MKVELQTNKDPDYIRNILESKMTMKPSLKALSLDSAGGRLSLDYGDDIDGASSLITDVLMEYKFPEYLSLYVKRDYSRIDEYFRSKAFLLTLKYFWCDDAGYRNTVKNKVGEYIYKNGVLNIDGFLCFKLRDFVEQWQNEYEGNIRMLTGAYEGTKAIMELAAYVASQPKNSSVVHISRHSGRFSFGRDIENTDFSYSAKEVFSLAINELPEKIYYHRGTDAGKDELGWILASVFGGSVTIIDF